MTMTESTPPPVFHKSTILITGVDLRRAPQLCYLLGKSAPPRAIMPTSSKRVSRLHSKDPADAAWRARQAQVDADIEGLSRDAEADRLVAEMDSSGVAPRQQIKRLKAYFRARQNKMGGP
jgi:hypothetical protein